MGSRWIVLAGTAAAVLAAPSPAAADGKPNGDWPSYRGDNRRSGRALIGVPLEGLAPRWVHRARQRPRPAWNGQARWDAYRSLPGLRSMRDYDSAFHVAVAGGRVYFGSSADDSVTCLDAATGKARWTFTTDGPVRAAPTIAGGRLYVGSDDGYVYCLDADDGKPVWTFSPATEVRPLINDGRVISRWPCRTGVVVEGGVAYFGNSLLPWRRSFLCAVDAATGKAVGQGRYVRSFKGLTFEGTMLAAGDRLVATQGRAAPAIFSRRDGRPAARVKKGGGGCFAVLTGDSELLHGPGNKTGWVSLTDLDSGEQLASYKGGNAMVVSGDAAFILTDDALTAIGRRTAATLWRVKCRYRFALILAGKTLFAGGRDEVAAFDVGTGRRLWAGKVNGDAHGLAAAGGALFVSTTEGEITCFRPGKPRANPPAAVAPDAPPAKPRRPVRPAPAPDGMIGPYLQFTGPASAVVRWRTREPAAGSVVFGLTAGKGVRLAAPAGTDHAVDLTGLKPDRLYTVTVNAGPGLADVSFECDTSLNFSPPDVSVAGPSSAAHAGAATRILARGRADRGIGLMVGCGDGRLALEMVRRSRLRMLCIDSSREKVDAARKLLRAAGVYGTRVVVRRAPSARSLRLPSHFANLVVIAARQLSEPAAEFLRVLRPGGVLLAAGPDAKTAVTKSAIAGAGQWSHQYGRADNTGFGGKTLGGATGTRDLQVHWIGRPGPRHQDDRQGRGASPLAAGGRLFTQGLRRIVALDAYNGAVSWSLEIPHLARFNIPRDTANWCADAGSVYAAVGNGCWRIDAADGRVRTFYAPVGPDKGRRYAWGYVATYAGKLIGSAVRPGGAFASFWGGGGWYDGRNGPGAAKVCSESLFALDKATGRAAWTYADGAVVNSTITVGRNRVYFIEARGAKATAAAGRLRPAEMREGQHLVCLDVDSGRKIWEIGTGGIDGTTMINMAVAGGKLIVVASRPTSVLTKHLRKGDPTGWYDVHAFDAANGKPAWKVTHPWRSDNHGWHMSRPVIVDEKLYVRPYILSLATGKRLSGLMGSGSCGTYVATAKALIQRSGSLGLWDPATGRTSTWTRLRPSCWLSAVPACGMLLAPEGGGGCSCGGWIEASIGFAPVAKGRAIKKD